MNLCLKTMVSNFELCVACLRVQVLHDHLCKVHYIWIEPLEEDVNTCHEHILLIFFGWWMGCANVWSYKPFHVAKDKVKRLWFNSPVNNSFDTLILTCS